MCDKCDVYGPADNPDSIPIDLDLTDLDATTFHLFDVQMEMLVKLLNSIDRCGLGFHVDEIVGVYFVLIEVDSLPFHLLVTGNKETAFTIRDRMSEVFLTFGAQPREVN